MNSTTNDIFAARLNLEGYQEAREEPRRLATGPPSLKGASKCIKAKTIVSRPFRRKWDSQNLTSLCPVTIVFVSNGIAVTIIINN
jgi:hypothetical protein